MRKIVYWYLLTFLALNILIGFLLQFIGLEGVIPVNPGQLIRAVLLICFFYALIKDQLKATDKTQKLFFVTFVYLLICSIWLGAYHGGFSGVVKDFYNVSKLLFVLLLAYMVYTYGSFFKKKASFIMEANFIILFANLFFGYATGIGLDTYDYLESSTKGFLYGGNSASVLSLIFFIYYLFQFSKGKKEKLYTLLAIFSIYMVGTKVIFLVPGIVGLYLLLKVDWTVKRTSIALALVVPVLIYLGFLILPLISSLLESRYLGTLERVGLYSKNASGSYQDALLAYRRISYMITQFENQLSSVFGFLFGYGEIGQVKFWSQQGRAFTFAAMDFFDIMFQYGILGMGLILSLVGSALNQIWIKGLKEPLAIAFFFIFLYSFFGGYVIFTTTSGTLFAFLLGLCLNGEFKKRQYYLLQSLKR